MTDDDLRAAVAAGHLTEAQAVAVLTLAQARAGQRATMTGDDEPFELFKGFAEIFISVGLVIVLGGMLGLAVILQSVLGLAAIGAGVAALLALYFTRKRRMTLPSIVLTTAFWMAATIGVSGWMVGTLDAIPSKSDVLVTGALVVAALGAWYWAFRVPFTMFLIGLSSLATLLMYISATAPITAYMNWQVLFDLGTGSTLAQGTFWFGIIAFIAGMAFDMRDPHRLGRFAASAFWLHLLAAPALVNTVAMTFLNRDDSLGYGLLGVALVLITLLALIIDRRSFLTAGITYFIILLTWLVDPVEQDGVTNALLVIAVGSFITATGAFWSTWRSAILRSLPDFPLKHRLAPYAR